MVLQVQWTNYKPRIRQFSLTVIKNDSTNCTLGHLAYHGHVGNSTVLLRNVMHYLLPSIGTQAARRKRQQIEVRIPRAQQATYYGLRPVPHFKDPKQLSRWYVSWHTPVFKNTRSHDHHYFLRTRLTVSVHSVYSSHTRTSDRSNADAMDISLRGFSLLYAYAYGRPTKYHLLEQPANLKF